MSYGKILFKFEVNLYILFFANWVLFLIIIFELNSSNILDDKTSNYIGNIGFKSIFEAF
jgi:hypothetical protein